MKKLIILRHAKSSWKSLNMNDYNRPINKIGLINATNIGTFIMAKEGKPDLILSSSAKRAYDTAQIVARETKYKFEEIKSDKSLYMAYIDDIIKLINKTTPDINKCIIVGHNPGFTELINHYGVRLNNLPTSSAACFGFDTDKWTSVSSNNANLIWFQLARNL